MQRKLSNVPKHASVHRYLAKSQYLLLTVLQDPLQRVAAAPQFLVQFGRAVRHGVVGVHKTQGFTVRLDGWTGERKNMCCIFFVERRDKHNHTYRNRELGRARRRGPPADDDHCNVRGTKRAARQYSLFEGHVELREWSSQGIDALTLESLVEYTLVHDVLDFSVEAGRLLRV